MTDDGWKFAEQLLGITAEALKQRAQYKARLEATQSKSMTNREAMTALEIVKAEAARVARDAGWRAGQQDAAHHLARVLGTPLPLPEAWDFLIALGEVTKRLHAPHGDAQALVDQVTRDAALEEVEREIARRCPDIGPAHVVFDVIRALKSKPAPEASGPKVCACHQHHEPHIHLASDAVPVEEWSSLAKRMSSAAGVSRVVVDPAHDPMKGAVVSPIQCLVPGCDRPHQHEGPHGGGGKPPDLKATMDAIQEESMKRAAEKWERGEMDGPTPEPVHDFGWALAQMKHGKRVRRKEWEGFQFVEFQPKANSIALFEGPGGEFWHWHPAQAAILATDWEAVP